MGTDQELSIYFVWSQYDGANIEQRTTGYGWRQNQEAKQRLWEEIYLDLTNKILIQPFTT